MTRHNNLNKEDYISVLNELDLPIWQWYIGEDRLEGNEKVLNIYGFDIHDALSEKWEQCIIDEDRSGIIRSLKEHINGKSKLYDVKYRYQHPISNEIRVLHSKGKIVQRNKNGLPLLMIGSVEDITQSDVKNLVKIKNNDVTEKHEYYNKALRIFDAFDEIVYVSDPITYDLLFVNQKIIDTLGKRQSIIGKKCYRVLQNEDSPCQFCTNDIIFKEKPNEKHVWEFQNQVNMRWYRCSDQAISWVNNTKVRMEVAIDITEEKNYLDKLKASDERFKLVNKASNNGIWDWYTNSNEVFYSDHWKEMLGYKPDELPNTFETWEALLHPECKDRMIKAVQDFLETPSEYFLQEFRMMHKDGSHRWILNKAASVLDEDGKVIRMFGAHSDVTYRREAEDKLRSQEMLYRGLIENAPDGIVMINEQGFFTFGSPSALKMFGYNNDELISTHPDLLTHPEDLPKVMKVLGDILDGVTKSTPTISYRFKTKEGDWKWIESTFSILKNSELEYNIVINFRDISERKQAEEELLNAKKKAESANIQKNQFLANMSHEIRTPMNGVVGFAELLKDEDLEESDRIQYLEVIDKNSKKLLTLIDDIIDVGKIESGDLKINNNTFELNALLKKLHLEFRANTKPEVDLILDLPNNDTLNIISDEIRLNQVLSNLITNSIKFTKEGNITIGYTVKKNELHFYVRDTGIGIRKNEIDDIFDRFKQATNNDSAVHGGTGLGLAICRGILRLMGGNISVESEFNSGSTFLFSIPLITQSDSAIKNPEKIKNLNINSIFDGKIIILAEDDFVNQEYFKAMLKKSTVRILIANNGEEAIKLYKEYPETDYIFMDIRMPIMNGYEAIKEILKIDKNAFIIAQTAYASQDERKKSLQEGCIEYISKPIVQDKLIQVIQKAKRKIM
jgi:two-component system CheB/CheR fusion protein